MSTEKSNIRRFIISSLATMALDVILFSTLTEMSGLSGEPASAVFRTITFLAALIAGFLLNKLWVFNNPYLGCDELKMQLRSFLAVSITAFVFYSVVTPALDILFTAGFPGASHRQLYRLASLIGASLSMIWSYYGYKAIVFNKESFEPILKLKRSNMNRQLRLQKR